MAVRAMLVLRQLQKLLKDGSVLLLFALLLRRRLCHYTSSRSKGHTVDLAGGAGNDWEAQSGLSQPSVLSSLGG